MECFSPPFYLLGNSARVSCTHCRSYSRLLFLLRNFSSFNGGFLFFFRVPAFSLRPNTDDPFFSPCAGYVADDATLRNKTGFFFFFLQGPSASFLRDRPFFPHKKYSFFRLSAFSLSWRPSFSFFHAIPRHGLP